ncbi:MAG: PASTA domain-containing protein [Longimicrobiales bacterium]
MLGDSLRRRRHGAPASEKPEQPEQPRKSGRPKGRMAFSRGRWILLALAVLGGSFGVGYLLATMVIFPPPDTAGTGVEVPDLYGRTQAEAEAALREMGLEAGEVTELRSLSADAGRVLAQAPLPGQELRPGATVSMGVSGGPPELRVPPLVGLGQATARELLETVGFDVAVQQTRNMDVPAGVVARAEPEPGTPQRLPAQVLIIVSTGPPLESVDSVDVGGFR